MPDQGVTSKVMGFKIDWEKFSGDQACRKVGGGQTTQTFQSKF